MNENTGAVFVQTNDGMANEVVAFRRGENGGLEETGRAATGGRGTGEPHLPSQGSIVFAGDRLIVANAGSNDVSLFSVGAGAPELVARVPSGGGTPTSVAVRDDLVYVLNKGGGDAPANLAGFRLAADGLVPVAESRRGLSSAEADPAQASFTPDGSRLIVTERGTDRISVFAVGDDGLLDGPSSHPSSGATPYGFGFTRAGVLVVTEAFGGEAGKAAASSYAVEGDMLRTVSGSVGDTRSEVCWAVIGADDRHAYVTNFGDGTISSYRVSDDGAIELHEAVAASLGAKGVRDEALTDDGRYLYALDADAGRVFGWSVGDDGALTPVGEANGLPATVAGLAAR
jgi:6-phosphogluconolactonase